MKKVNILDARNNLSKLVAAASAGEEIVIANRGKPVARLVSVAGDAPTHTAGSAAAWLASHPVPRQASRSITALDQQIASEREGWE